MKFAIITLVACASAFVVASARESIYEKEGHVTDLRIRLGHFKEKPFVDLYMQYATAFVYPLHKHEYGVDDYRNFMPSGHECLVFFRTLRGQEHKVKDFNDFIRLDACLGYLFDSDNHDLDTETSEVDKQHIATLKQDQKLVELYTQTKINELSDEAKSCVADLLLSNVLARYQYSSVTCNNNFLQLYLQFAECQNGVITAEQRAEDSYLKVIYEILKIQVNKCFDVEVDLINQAIRSAYAKDSFSRAKLSVKRVLRNSLAKQQYTNMWPSPIVRLLAAVQDTTKEINLRYVHKLVHGFYEGDQVLIKKFEENLAKFADRELEPKPTDVGGEEKVQARYRELVDRTCQFFRSSDSEANYDYATPLIRMVQLLNYQDLFEVTSDKFVHDMLTRAKEIVPVYLSVSVCNLMTFTEGTIPTPNTNTKLHYTVKFVPDLSRLPKWPDAGYF